MSKEKLRKRILQLVEQYGEENTINTPFEKGKSVILPSGKVIGVI
jgi:hypothetical protein